MSKQFNVIIVASGLGTRFGNAVPKQFQLLDDAPILKRTIHRFNDLDAVSNIIVTVPEGYINEVLSYGFEKVNHVIIGGTTRADSVYAALKMIDLACEVVLIHDGARPLVATETIMAVAEAARSHGAAIAATPITDTIKRVKKDGVVSKTIDRKNLYQAQTPQGFHYALIYRAYQQGDTENVLGDATDDASLLERLGENIFIVPSSKTNMKITTPDDLVIASALLKMNNDALHAKIAMQKNHIAMQSEHKQIDDKIIYLYTDGGASPNPGPGGYGVVLKSGNNIKELSGSYTHTTNNRMEIMGVIKGLEALKKPSRVLLTSDSKYVIDALKLGWAEKWRANHWMRTKTDPALNSDLWAKLLDLTEVHEIDYRWVRGHTGHPENERCDALATAAILNKEKWQEDIVM